MTQIPRKTPLKVSSAKVGGMMSLAFDDLGALWMWETALTLMQSKSSEGEFALISSSTPILIWNFHGHTVIKVILFFIYLFIYLL